MISSPIGPERTAAEGGPWQPQEAPEPGQRRLRPNAVSRFGSRWLRRRLRRLVADEPDLAEQIGDLHAAERFKQCRNLGGDFRNVTGELVGAGGVPVAGGDNGDLVDLAERLAKRANYVGETAEELVDDCGLVVLLEGLGLDIHRAGFGVALLEDDFGLGFALSADRGGLPFGFGHQALTLGVGKGLDTLALDFGLLQDGGDEFTFTPGDFGFLHFDLGLALDLLNAHLLGHNGLLLAIGFDFVGLVGLRLGFFGGFEITGLFDVEVALGLGLLGKRSGFGSDAFLVGLRFGDSRSTGGLGAFDGDVAFGLGGGNLSVALDAGDVGPTHVGDVFVLVANFLDGEAHDFKPHLAHVFGAGGAHAAANHFRLLDDLLDGELADDAAQVTLHHQADETLTLFRALGEELFGRRANRNGVGLYLQLCNGLDRDRYALVGVQTLLGRHVERHQFEGELLALLHHRKDDRAPTLDDAGVAEAVDDQGFVRTHLAIHARDHGADGQDREHRQPGDNPNTRELGHMFLPICSLGLIEACFSPS